MAPHCPSPASSHKPPAALQLALLGGLGLFALGWALGRCSAAESEAGPATSTATSSPGPVATQRSAGDGGAVELRLDAGGLRLTPDASLHLKPIEPLDLEVPVP